MRGRFALAGLLLLLAACGRGEDEVRPGALTADEDRQLNEAAAMLDEPENGGAAGAPDQAPAEPATER